MTKVKILTYVCFITINSQRITLWITEKCCETLIEEKKDIKRALTKKKCS